MKITAICLLIFLNLIKKTNIFQTATTQKQSRHYINIKIIKLGCGLRLRERERGEKEEGVTQSASEYQKNQEFCATFSSFLM